MSQLDKKIKWCLDKAQRELKLQQKHRGLVKITPNIDEAKKHLAKAEHNFRAVLNFENTFPDWSVSAAFYTIYHCFLAIITKFGYESRNQECTVALMKQLWEEGSVKMDKDLIEALNFEEIDLESNVINLRENFQYGTDTKVQDKKLEKLKELCRRAIEQAKKEVYGEELKNSFQ